MKYHKSFEHIIFGGFSRNEFYAISVYLMIYAQTENIPNDRRLKVWLNEDEINFINEFFKTDEGSQILTDAVLEPLSYLNKKKELNKKRYSGEKKENKKRISGECLHDMTEHERTEQNITEKNTSYFNNKNKESDDIPKSFLPVINEIVNVYNTVMKDYPLWPQINMTSVSKKRRLKIKEIWDNQVLSTSQAWEEYFFTVGNSDFHKVEKFGTIDGIFTEWFVLQILEGNHGAFRKLPENPEFYFRMVEGKVEYRKKINGKLITANPQFN